MKKVCLIIWALGIVIAFSNFAWAECTTIQDGTLLDSADFPISTGYDDFGYNYQAQIFNGRYCDYDRVIGGDYCDVELIMKWNDAWLSKTDCNDDFLLDRHFSYPTYIGSGAWLTNHQSGWVEMPNGKIKKWTYFVKIVAVPSDATLNIDDYWESSSGTIIGPNIWGQFAVIEEVINDPSEGLHGIQYKSPTGPGFGIYGAE